MNTYNSINQVIAYLKKNSHKTEKEILLDVWNYERASGLGKRYSGTGFIVESNKKYADLIRRGIQTQKIFRVSGIRNNRRTWLYTADNV